MYTQGTQHPAESNNNLIPNLQNRNCKSKILDLKDCALRKIFGNKDIYVLDKISMEISHSDNAFHTSSISVLDKKIFLIFSMQR